MRDIRILAGDAAENAGRTITLMGWVGARRDHGKLIFIELRDISGKVQVVFSPKNENAFKIAARLRPEWVISASGLVKKRPAGAENPDAPSGNIEVEAEKLEVLSESLTPPFDLSGSGFDIGEENRLKYRYLDLRRPRLRDNIRARDKIAAFARDYLHKLDFCEIETPILTKSTPEGARDYIVPSRLHPGNFYALPQSPQQYKQLLMVAGFEKYFQVARCFRDEDTRGDRQPEFTQLDLEMSFVDRKDVLALTEDLFVKLAENVFPDKKIMKKPFPVISYKEAIGKYGSDKPDLRLNKNTPDELAFAFVVDFPMFEKKEDGSPGVFHHPFTKIARNGRPDGDIVEMLKKEPKNLLSEQYDLVLNGEEIGGGSIREHKADVLQAIFEALGHEKNEIQDKFGHLFEAFAYGVPPHGGIAIGLDRLAMMLCGEKTVREVIAFPKTGDGRDLMMKAPSEADKTQLGELGLSVKRQKSGRRKI